MKNRYFSDCAGICFVWFGNFCVNGKYSICRKMLNMMVSQLVLETITVLNVFSESVIGI